MHGTMSLSPLLESNMIEYLLAFKHLNGPLCLSIDINQGIIEL